MERAKNAWATVWHRYLRVPYTLHVYRRSKPRFGGASTLVFLHGIGNSGATWDAVVKTLPEGTDYIIVDLLGFGESPQPDWMVYSARTQANALAKTLLVSGMLGRVVLVGHSMGALVAVEFAKRYPGVVKSLILCSPPMDKEADKRLFRQRHSQLKWLFEQATRRPTDFVAISGYAKRLGLLSPAFNVTAETVGTFMMALKANVLGQTTAHDIARVRRPIHIIYGVLDPVVIGDTLKSLAKTSRYIQVTSVMVGHEIVGRYVGKIAAIIKTELMGETK